MATYAENAAKAELRDRRAAQDVALRERHARWDVQAQDKRHKYERPHFAVLGEGSRSANENYLRNYDRIFSLSSRRGRSLLASAGSSTGTVVAAG
jgi:hypothetical protein